MSDHRHALNNHPARVSFTVRRPSPVSRASSTGTDQDTFRVPPPPKASPLAPPQPQRRFANQRHESDSDEEEDDHETDELVTGFDEMGVRR